MKRSSWILGAVLVAVVMLMVGCNRPFMTPITEEIKNNETAFLVNLEGTKDAQKKLFIYLSINRGWRVLNIFHRQLFQ